jgi:formate/nitrite transporter
MAETLGIDAYSPKEIAERVESIGVTKARLPIRTMSALGVVAGAFIGLGALYFTLVTSDPNLSFGVSRILGGVTFSLGLILVVVAGAELFTGNNLMVMAWADNKISTGELLRNWLVIFVTNLVGAMGLAVIVALSNHAGMNEGAVGTQMVKIAAAKVSLPFWEALFKGVLCNLLVCLAVWMTLAGRSVTDKVLAVIFPISAFVASGFEHSVANMYFIPLGILLRDRVVVPSAVNISNLDWPGFLQNLIPVTIGNIIGGSAMVALAYYVIYRMGLKTT